MRISAVQERKFEKSLITRQKEKYLCSDAVERYQNDIGYRKKVELIRGFLDNYRPLGFILDVGSNTSGESEVLSHYGYQMVPTDVNEIALSFSKKRAQNLRAEKLSYFASDAHKMPVADDVFGAVVAVEVLHHMEELEVVLRELYRVLCPGGFFFTIEPYALNPYRRLSEVRDYFRGTIEKSFTVTGLKKRIESSGLKVISAQKVVLPPSEWKKKNVNGFRARLKDIYYAVSKRMPWLFGFVVMVAQKPGDAVPESNALENRFICPITKSPLVREGDAYISTNKFGKCYRYPVYEGIPVLIEEDAQEIK